MSSIKKRSHDESRSLVCACCGRKNLKCLKISENLESLIQEFIFDRFSVKSTTYPTGVCPSCKVSLFVAKKKGLAAVSKKIRATWNVDFEKFPPPARNGTCSCPNCTIVRASDVGNGAPSDVPRRKPDDDEENPEDEEENTEPDNSTDQTVNNE